MKSFSIIDSIPTQKCGQMTVSNQNINFVSSNSFYAPKHIVSLPSTIVSFATAKYHFLLTQQKLYQTNSKGEIITTMNITKRCSMVRVHENRLFLFFDGSFEIYEIPESYQPVMYKLINRTLTESSIVCVDFCGGLMICGCQDNSVRIYETGVSETFLGSYMGRVVACFMNGREIIVVSENDIFFYDVDIKSENGALEFSKKTIVNNIHSTQIEAACLDKNEGLLFIGREDEKFIIEVYKNNDLYLTPEIEFGNIRNICVGNGLLGVVTDNGILLYDYTNNLTLSTVDISEIHSMNAINDIIALGTKNAIRIYRDFKEISSHKLQAQSKIIFIHPSRSILITISSLGTVKLYDIQNLHCFKTFDIDKIALSSATNEDGSLLFLGNESICIYDTKRGSVIDELKSHTGPVFKLKYKSSYIYSLGMDNYLRKQYIYDTKRDGHELENINGETLIDFDLGLNLYVLTRKEVIIYDLNFNFIKSFLLDSKYKMTYEKIAVMNDSLVFVYGHTKNYKEEIQNCLNIYSVEHLVKIQEMRTGAVCDIKAMQNAVLLLTEHGLKIVGQKSLSFDPIDIEVSCTPENVEYLIGQNKLLALISAVKLNDLVLVNKVVKSVPEPEIGELVRYFPQKYVPVLRTHINQIENNLVWIKNITFWHTGIGERFVLDKDIKDGMQYARMNHYILEAYKRKR